MSILKSGNEEDIVVTRKSPQDVAERLLSTTKKAYQILVNLFNETSTMFWLNQQGHSPQQIADALGKNGKELFEIHGKLGAFLASFDPDAIELGLVVVGDFKFLEDGSVKIIEFNEDTEEAAPSTEEAAPSTEEAAPSTEEAAPSTEEAAPSTEEAAPSTEEAAPSTEEAAPSTEEASGN